MIVNKLNERELLRIIDLFNDGLSVTDIAMNCMDVGRAEDTPADITIRRYLADIGLWPILGIRYMACDTDHMGTPCKWKVQDPDNGETYIFLLSETARQYVLLHSFAKSLGNASHTVTSHEQRTAMLNAYLSQRSENYMLSVYLHPAGKR